MSAGGCGFCTINGVACAALHALHAHGDTIKRAVIIDFDVHHGNGTESIVRNLPEITGGGLLYASTHQYEVFPGTGGDDDFFPVRWDPSLPHSMPAESCTPTTNTTLP